MKLVNVHRSVILLLPSALLIGSGFAQTGNSNPPFRLAADIAAPVRYAIDLTMVPDSETFKGTAAISVEIKKRTSELWLNSEKLQIREATLSTSSGSSPVKVIPTPHNYLELQFPEPVEIGRVTLRLSYQGEISRKDMAGAFQVKDGDQWYIYTQFESIDARRAFPCFDEPGFKVPWQLTLHVKKDQAALSNTPVDSEQEEPGGMKAVRFKETPPISSYLVAFAVGNFEFAEAGDAGQKRTRVRIVTPHGRASEAKYAVETSPEILDRLEKYFGIPYPYEKLDEVAIPLAGFAMEHPGLVTFGASIIISKPENETIGTRRTWVSIASHELAHQWFGDLVTTEWWDDIWLNEGFASWMSNKIVNQYHPEWQMNVAELNGYQRAMEQDALVSARKVRQPIESNDDIANAFDGITYNKGSALLNMFETWMGAERFRARIQAYLKQYAWKNATSAQFLAVLTGDDPEVAPAFNSFLDQSGVPLISANLKCEAGSAKVEITQERFLPLGSNGAAGSQLWSVPVCLRYSGDTGNDGQCTLLRQKASVVNLERARACPEWLVANAGANGYYRTIYKDDMLDKLLTSNAAALTVPERVSTIGDIQALTGNGSIPLGSALALAPGLVSDPNRTVVNKTLKITSGLQDTMVEPSLLPKYRLYLASLYGPRARQLGLTGKPGDSDDERLLRPTLADVIANQAEDPETQAEARRLVLAWLVHRDAVSPEMISIVLQAAAIHGDRALFDRMRAAARVEKDEQVQASLLFAMGSFRDPEIVRLALPILLTDEFDIRQSLSLLFGASQSSASRDMAYDFVKANWDKLVPKLPTDMAAYFPYLAAGYCDEQHRRDVESYFQGRSTEFTGGPRILSQVLEGIDLCIAYRKAQRASVTQFLQSYNEAKQK